MQLLSQDKTQSAKEKSEAERKERVQKLNDEETAITKRVNDARENELKEKAIIAADLDTFRKKKDTEKSVIENSIIALRAEVTDLEARKAKAMEPVDALRNEAETRLTLAGEKEAENGRTDLRLKEDQNTLVERTQALVGREESQRVRKEDLDKREERVKAEEAKSKESANVLAGKWVEYHKQVSDANENLGKREREIVQREQANESFAETLREEDKRIRAADAVVKDKYVALAQAKKHLGIE